MTAESGRPCPWNEQAAGWALRALEPEEERDLLGHREHCPSCQDVVRETEQLIGLVGAHIEQIEPPARLRDALLAGAARTPQAHRPQKELPPAPAPSWSGAATPGLLADPRLPAEPRGSRWRESRLVAAGVATAAVLGLGALTAYTVELHGQRDVGSTQVQRLAEIIIRSQQPGSVNVTLTAEGRPLAAVMVVDGRTTLVSGGLTPNDTAASTYVLWGLGGAAPRALAAFDVVDTAPGPRWSGAAPDEYSGYAVSLEPGRAAPAAPTAVVAAGRPG